MPAYIIRLDDACPYMDEKAWERIEIILNRYEIKPIVGIIPDSRNPEFNHGFITDFWDSTARRYRDNGWVIAQHGYRHYFRRNTKTEFAGLGYEEQKNLILAGNQILQSHGIVPECFFAPAHSFDDNTVDAIRDSGLFRFISDGYAFAPFQYRGMLFIPSLFNTPHRMCGSGVYTFVFHPNAMKERDFVYLEDYLRKYNCHFRSLDTVLPYEKVIRKRNFLEHLVEWGIKAMRAGRYGGGL